MASIRSLRPSEIVAEFGLSDHIKVDDEIGTTFGRVMLLLVWIVVSVWVGIVCYGVVRQFGTPSILNGIMGTGVALALSLLGLYPTLIPVGALTGFMSVSMFGGRAHIYGTGYHLKYPWEQMEYRHFINLQLLTLPVRATFTTRDGVEIYYDVTIHYRCVLRLLPLTVRVDSQQLENAIGTAVRSVLSQEMLALSSSDLRHSETVRRLGDSLTSRFGSSGVEEALRLQAAYGIEIERISLSEPGYGSDYIKATTSQAIVGKVVDVAQSIKDFGASSESAMNSALVLNDRAKRKITTVESQELAKVLSDAIEALARSKA